jgi:hypothetical protein
MESGNSTPTRDEDLLLGDDTDKDADHEPVLNRVLSHLSSLSEEMKSIKKEMTVLKAARLPGHHDPPGTGEERPAKRARVEPPAPPSPVPSTSDADGQSAQADMAAQIMQMDDSGDDEPDDDKEGLASLDAVLGATDDSGPPVSDKLATIMKRYGKKIEDSSLRALLGKYKIPNNCPSLGVPLTNQEVHSCLSSSVRRADTRIPCQRSGCIPPGVTFTRP